MFAFHKTEEHKLQERIQKASQDYNLHISMESNKKSDLKMK